MTQTEHSYLYPLLENYCPQKGLHSIDASFSCSVEGREFDVFDGINTAHDFEPLTTGVILRDLFKQQVDTIFSRSHRSVVLFKSRNRFHIFGYIVGAELNANLAEIARIGQEMSIVLERTIQFKLGTSRPPKKHEDIDAILIDWNPDGTGSVKEALSFQAGEGLGKTMPFNWRQL